MTILTHLVDEDAPTRCIRCDLAIPPLQLAQKPRHGLFVAVIESEMLGNSVYVPGDNDSNLQCDDEALTI